LASIDLGNASITTFMLVMTVKKSLIFFF